MGSGSLPIQWTTHRQATPLQDVSVDHRRPHVLMAEQLLNGADVVTGLEKVGGKGVAEGVTGDALEQANLLSGPANGALQGRGIEMMATFFPLAAGVK